MPLFQDRGDAGRRLAHRLDAYGGRGGEVVVLGLPRGGVPVAFEVARSLDAPLDVFVVRKLGVPGQEELAFGAIASGGVRVLNPEIIRTAGIDEWIVESTTAHEAGELARREEVYRGGQPLIEVRDRAVILIDDGLATGASMRAAVAALRRLRPARIIVAVPAAAGETCAEIRREVDDLVCLATPYPFGGVGAWYEDFSQTTDEEVRELLQQAREKPDEGEPEARRA